MFWVKSCCNLQTTPWHIWDTSKMIICHPESSSVFMSARLLIRPEIHGHFVIDFSVCVLVLCICPSSYWLLCTSSRPSSTAVFWTINSDDDKIGANVASALMREQRTSKQTQSSRWVFCRTSHQLLSSTWKSLRVSDLEMLIGYQPVWTLVFPAWSEMMFRVHRSSNDEVTQQHFVLLEHLDMEGYRPASFGSLLFGFTF